MAILETKVRSLDCVLQITQNPGAGSRVEQGREGGQWLGIFKSNSFLDPVPRPLPPPSCHIRRDAVI